MHWRCNKKQPAPSLPPKEEKITVEPASMKHYEDYIMTNLLPRGLYELQAWTEFFPSISDHDLTREFVHFLMDRTVRNWTVF